MRGRWLFSNPVTNYGIPAKAGEYPDGSKLMELYQRGAVQSGRYRTIHKMIAIAMLMNEFSITTTGFSPN